MKKFLDDVSRYEILKRVEERPYGCWFDVTRELVDLTREGRRGKEIGRKQRNLYCARELIRKHIKKYCPSR